ncbi:hypothetical protein OF83DRAFT_743319 [Amylostereum chailletii]|nr:hypothetical protein OF83DRAFT_743319 [Amylostereum chailletii]
MKCAFGHDRRRIFTRGKRSGPCPSPSRTPIGSRASRFRPPSNYAPRTSRTIRFPPCQTTPGTTWLKAISDLRQSPSLSSTTLQPARTVPHLSLRHCQHIFPPCFYSLVCPKATECPSRVRSVATRLV